MRKRAKEGDLDGCQLICSNKAEEGYVCGAHGYVDAVRDAARELGVPEDRIHTEDGW